MTNDFSPTEWITTKEAAELTGYADAHFRRLIGEECLQATKRGGAWFLHKKDVLAYAEEMKRLGQSKHAPWRTGARKKNAHLGIASKEFNLEMEPARRQVVMGYPPPIH